MKKLLLLLSFVACFLISKAQNPGWLWAITDNGGAFEYGQGIEVDSSGDSIIVGGRCTGSSTYGGITVNTGGSMYPFRAKFDSSGKAVWYTYDPIGGFDYCWSICRDKFNNTYGTGTINSGGNSWVDKYDNKGNIKWAVQPGGGGPTGVAADNSGNVYVFISGFGGNLSFGGLTITNSGSGDGSAIIKLDSLGNAIWGKAIYGSGSSRAGDIITDNLGHLYVMGGYTGTYTFGSIVSPASSGIGNLFVAEFDTAGNSIMLATATNADYWNNAYSSDRGLVIDPCGNLYLTGYIQNSAQFGTFSVNSTGDEDMFVAKLSNNGQWQWVTTASGPGQDHGYSVALDKNYNVYVAGDYGENSGTGINFGAGMSFGGTGTFAAKFDNGTGNPIWAQVAGVANSDHVYGMAVDKFGYMYVTGDYGSSTTYGATTLTGSNGYSNIFLAKLDTAPSSEIYPINITGTYCPGSTVPVVYTVRGNFISGNNFIVQLSDSTGSFVNAVNLDTVSSTNGGTIMVTIPANTPTGSNYMIRIISSTPAISSYSGCPGFAVGNSLNATVVPANDTLCTGGSVTIKATGGSTYLWSTNATADSIIVSPTQNTTYTVLITNGSCSITDTGKVVVNTVLPLQIYPPGASICSGQTITLKAPVSGSNYVWTPSTSLSATTGDSVVANPTTDITYTVSGLDSLGCTVTGTEPVNVGQGPNQPVITESVTGDTLFSSAKNGNQWYVNRQPVSGATDSFYVISGLPKGDTVKVAVTDIANGCSTTSDAFITGINQLIVGSGQLTVYPNPTNGMINVTINSSSGEVKDWSLQVIDVLGRTLYSKSSLSYNNVLDLTNLPGGMYFITVINKTGRSAIPIVKQN